MFDNENPLSTASQEETPAAKWAKTVAWKRSARVGELPTAPAPATSKQAQDQAQVAANAAAADMMEEVATLANIPTMKEARTVSEGLPLYVVSDMHTKLATELSRITLCWHNMLAFYQTVFSLELPALERQENKNEFYQRADVVLNAQVEFAEDFTLRGLVAEEAELFEQVKTIYAFVVENLNEMVASLDRFIPADPKPEIVSIPTMTVELALGIIDGMNPLYRLINNGLIGAVVDAANEAVLLYLLNYEDDTHFYSVQYESPLPINKADELQSRANIKNWLESHQERTFEVFMIDKTYVTGDAV